MSALLSLQLGANVGIDIDRTIARSTRTISNLKLVELFLSKLTLRDYSEDGSKSGRKSVKIQPLNASEVDDGCSSSIQRRIKINGQAGRIVQPHFGDFFPRGDKIDV